MDARALRLLFTSEHEFWAEHRTGDDTRRIAAELERLLAGARARLPLDAPGAAKLERLVRDRVAVAARRSWRYGIGMHWDAARPLLRFGLEGASRATAAKAGAVYVLAPALPAARGLERAAGSVWSQPWAQPVKRRAKRLRLARGMYRLARIGRR